MTTEARTIRFYFDYVSTNAYLAWKRLPALAARHGAAIEPVPVLFAGLLEASGQLGPAEVPAKAWWMWRNNLRKAVLLDVPLSPPIHHPFNPLLALRVSSLSLEVDTRRALIDGLFDAVWVRGLHVSDPEVVRRVADAAGADGAGLVAQAGEPAAKARLREQTDAAIARGIFGVPSMAFDDEVFWGYDDLPFLDLRLAGDDPIARAAGARSTWVPSPSATRRRFRADGER